MLESSIMSDGMLLDGLFLLIALLFLPIGFGRGVQREVFVTAAALAGATLSASWARPWGQDLADLINLSTGVGQFSVSAAFLIGTVIVLGYGGGAAVRFDRPGLWGRLSGALLATINGTLVTAFLLRDVERFLADAATERSLKESAVAWMLLRDFGWVLLTSALIVLAPILVSFIAGRRDTSVLTESGRVGSYSWRRAERAERGRRRRLGWGRDDGKVEPLASDFDAKTGRYGADAPRYRDTMPIAPVESSVWSVDRARGTIASGPEWLQIATEPGSVPVQPVEPATLAAVGVDPVRCLGCGERLRTEDAFCPRCGRGL